MMNHFCTDFGIPKVRNFATFRIAVVQRCRNIRVVGTDRFLVYRQRPLKQRLGVGIATLVFVNPGDVVQRCRNIRVVGTESFLKYH